LLGDEVVARALEDHHDPSIAAPLQAALGFVEELTLRPDSVDEQTVDAAVRAGVSPAALRDAIEVCAAFNVIDRIADALDFERQTEGALRVGARRLSTRGYA
jgi:alkylhydroperoxidase family enzyme